MRFSIKSGDIFTGDLRYIKSEHSMDFTGISDDGERLRGYGCSIVIDSLQFEIDPDSGRLMFPWGYFPISDSRSGIAVPDHVAGRVYIDEYRDLAIGVSERIPGTWTAFWSKDMSHILMENTLLKNWDDAIEIASGVIVGVRHGSLSRVWLAPTLLE